MCRFHSRQGKDDYEDNEVFSKPLHFEIDEKNIKVSQGDEMAQLRGSRCTDSWQMIRGYLYSATGRMHTFSQRSSWATAMSVKGAGRQYTGEIQTENQINKNEYLEIKGV